MLLKFAVILIRLVVLAAIFNPFSDHDPFAVVEAEQAGDAPAHVHFVFVNPAVGQNDFAQHLYNSFALLAVIRLLDGAGEAIEVDGVFTRLPGITVQLCKAGIVEVKLVFQQAVAHRDFLVIHMAVDQRGGDKQFCNSGLNVRL